MARGRFSTRVATLTVDGGDDDLLGPATDVAIVDVRDLEKISIYVNHVTDDPIGVEAAAELDLGAATAGNLDTVIQAPEVGTHGNEITLQLIAGGSGVGVLDESGYPAITFTFETGVTTVSDFEAAIADSAYLAVNTPGTGAALFAAGDVMAATALAGGSEGTFSLDVEKTIDGTNFVPVETITEADFLEGDNKAYEITLSDANGMALPVAQVRVTVAANATVSKFSVTAAGVER